MLSTICFTEAVYSLRVFIDTAVCSVISEPLFTAFTELSISCVVSPTAFADLPASVLTSSATTANPLPASPALAASTAAFSASMFVWNAISSIVLIMLLILPEVSLMLFIASVRVCIFWFTSSTNTDVFSISARALSQLSALSCMPRSISARLCASASTEALCSMAPWDNTCAPEATSPEPELTWSAAS